MFAWPYLTEKKKKSGIVFVTQFDWSMLFAGQNPGISVIISGSFGNLWNMFFDKKKHRPSTD